MYRRWYILTALAGSVVGAAVGLWPAGPMWRSGPDAGRLEGFSPDGAVLFTSRTPHWNWIDRCPDPEILRWDVATGRLLARVALPCTEQSTVRLVRLSADGQTALVGEGRLKNPTQLNFETGEWYLHDGVTGTRQAGPVPGIARASDLSPDGRWFVGTRGHAAGGWKALGGEDIYSSADGARAVSLSEENGLKVAGCQFAPDGATVAVWWSGKDQPIIQVLDLPSGRERGRVQLPPRPWVRIDKWDGRRLEAVEREPEDPSGQSLWRAWSFDLSQQPVGEGIANPLLSVPVRDAAGRHFWIDGSEWVVYGTLVAPPPPLPWWWDRFHKALGLSRPPGRQLLSTARLVDRATGATRYKLPHAVGHPLRMSPDGQRLACMGDGDSVEVWDMDPLRWPWAIAAGVAASAGVLALGRGRRRALDGARPIS